MPLRFCLCANLGKIAMAWFDSSQHYNGMIRTDAKL
uniref:Uncharacterized protein n=1 Tax=Arundo donax TaxID=35708 RepID=A0A0A9SS90_ARUDO